MNKIYSEEDFSIENKNAIQNAKKMAENWSDLETLISTISSRFLGDIEIDDTINATLRDIGILNGTSRAILYIFNHNEVNLNHTYEWCAEGINPLFQYFSNSWFFNLPWWSEQLRKGEIINISDISNLIDEAKATKNLLRLNNIHSLLVFPLYIKRDLAGFIAYANDSIQKEWKEKDLSLLRISSQIIGNGLERKITEVMLKESEEKHRRIIENINDLIIILNLKLKIEYFNEKTAFRLLGYQKKEILGKSWLDFTHPDDTERASYTLKYALEKGETVIELRFRHKERHWLWYECSFKTFKDKEGKVRILVISRDITDRILVEKRYKNLFDNSPNAILLINFNGIIIDANTTTERVFGYEKDYFIQKSIDDLITFFPFEVKLFFKEIFHASFVKDFPKPIEIKLEKQDGDFIWAEIQASLIKQRQKTLIQLIFEDITEKKHIFLT
ncbi:hypothetical protein LCGC14_0824720 [marine sediment metagenome]|uniref:PAS domain-containing protein n=1 Tax=marine sediment metagenome TaxID=412755 RepID=A0A0F9S2M7_9ZZZZ